ncbi:MAG: TraB/GumN family protein [Caulobacteraceae bacterium]|nr:TraB/GumN family protein [Caulobacteraceae bacterium]
MVIPSRFQRLIALVCGFCALAAAGAASAGPAWWRVSDGRSEVWILGAPQVAPRDFSWDTSALERRLATAPTLIVGPQSKDKLQEAGLLFNGLVDLRSPTPMEATLPPALRQQFVATREAIGQGPRRYAGWKPAVAGVMLSGDYFKARDLQPQLVESQVRKLARAKGIKEVPSGEFDPTAMIHSARTLNEPGQQTCLAASLHTLSVGADRMRDMAAGWARGEIQVIPLDSVDRACLAAAPGFSVLTEHAAALESNAVAQALSSSPHAVAIFDLRTIVMPGGVLERLRARGLQVSGPVG